MQFLWVLLLGTAQLGACQEWHNFTLGSFVVKAHNATDLLGRSSWNIHVGLKKDHVRVVWSGSASSHETFMGVSGGTFEAKEGSGNFKITDKPTARTTGQTVEAVTGSRQAVRLTGQLLGTSGENVASYSFEFTTTSASALAFKASATPAPTATTPLNRVYASWDTLEYENFYGLGEQYTVHGLRGRVVPVISTEQGVGRGLEPLTWLVNKDPDGGAGNWHTTYTALPHLLSNRNRSFYIEDSRYMTFDLAAEHNLDLVDLMVLTGETDLTVCGQIITGEPRDLVKEYTGMTGRMTGIAPWSMRGAVVGWEGGTAATRALYQQLKAANVSMAAFWLQDWTGLRTDAFGKRLWWNWELDEDWYPGWDELVAELAADDVKMTTYINPYLSNSVEAHKPNARRNLWAEAAALGFVLKNSSGDPYLQHSASKTFSFSAVDFTNPEARTWYKGVIRCNMLGDQRACPAGMAAIKGAVSGWMADFGEYLPFDSVPFAGEAATVHNQYPTLWAQTCREAVKEAGLENEITFWSRSAGIGGQKHTYVYWAGDQLTSWDSFDGMQSALRGMLSGGLAGMALTHSDIGGYTMFNYKVYKFLRSAELLQRWAELSAFSGAIFRTHPGVLPGQSAQINSDNSTLTHFAFFSHVHASLADYRLELAAQAAKTGAPLVRYMFWEYPNNPACWDLADQFMLGPDFLIAPVMTEGMRHVDVYFPVGDWTHVWSGEISRVTTAGVVHVEAPVGLPAAYTRVPLYADHADSTLSHLAEEARLRLQGLTRAHL